MSTEKIYQSIYIHGRGGRKRGIATALLPVVTDSRSSNPGPAVALCGLSSPNTPHRTAPAVEAVRCLLSRFTYSGLRMTLVQPSTRSSKFL